MEQGTESMDQATLLVTCRDSAGAGGRDRAAALRGRARTSCTPISTLDRGRRFFQRIQCDTRAACRPRHARAAARRAGPRAGHDLAARRHRPAQAHGDPRLAPRPLPLRPAARRRAGELRTTFVCVISNHPNAAAVAGLGLPFHHLRVTPETRPAQEAELRRSCTATRSTWSCSPATCRSCPTRSWTAGLRHQHPPQFLPAFSGSQPYERSYERGVKLSGAMAHYVTPEPAPGPIIEQDVVRH